VWIARVGRTLLPALSEAEGADAFALAVVFAVALAVVVALDLIPAAGQQ
jgi:hypothetical protein